MKKLGSQPVQRVLATAQEFAREAVPQIQSAPVWFVYEILVAAGMGIGQEKRDLLLSPAIKHPESQRGRLQVINCKGAPSDLKPCFSAGRGGVVNPPEPNCAGGFICRVR